MIIDCDGKYEVHPISDTTWAVVNSETGQVRSKFTSEDDAVEYAEELNMSAFETVETVARSIESSISNDLSIILLAGIAAFFLGGLFAIMTF